MILFKLLKFSNRYKFEIKFLYYLFSFFYLISFQNSHLNKNFTIGKDSEQ